MRWLILPRCNGKTYMADNLYKAACEYMAETEQYNRSLTNRRTQYDPTEAFIDAYMRGLAVSFAQYVRSDVTKKYCITPFELGEEIGRHRSYSAQMWIDEYERLQQGGE